MTNGKGVDIVLNSLTGELFQASINCLAQRGRFLELGKVEFMNRTSIDSHIFLKNCSFNGIFVDDLFHEPHEDKFRLQKMLAEGESIYITKHCENFLWKSSILLQQIATKYIYF